MTHLSNPHQFNLARLRQQALEIRRLILATTHRAKMGHTGGSLSETEILTALYFQVMRYDPKQPKLPGRDRFILSKGHASPGYYATLASAGFFGLEVLETFDEIGSPLQAHPCMQKCIGVDYTTGSLGQGLSLALGMALGIQRRQWDARVWALLGDGEMAEGQIWEAILWAGAHKQKQLIAILDYNKVQLASYLADAVPLEPVGQKLAAFQWRVLETDGHDMAQLVETLQRAYSLSADGPVFVIAHTVKGKGVSFMENTHIWHGKAPNDEEYHRALSELAQTEQIITEQTEELA